jgi:hypothetical protein
MIIKKIKEKIKLAWFYLSVDPNSKKGLEHRIEILKKTDLKDRLPVYKTTYRCNFCGNEQIGDFYCNRCNMEDIMEQK